MIEYGRAKAGSSTICITVTSDASDQLWDVVCSRDLRDLMRPQVWVPFQVAAILEESKGLSGCGCQKLLPVCSLLYIYMHCRCQMIATEQELGPRVVMHTKGQTTASSC